MHTQEQDDFLDALEGPGGVGSTWVWEDEMWGRQELFDNPIKNTVHEFNCTMAKRAQVVVHHTTSDLFAIAEIELMGYPMTGNTSASPCPLRCRHGGSCLKDTQQRCSCPVEWGWSGDRCRVCNRSDTPSHYETFNVDIEAVVMPTIFNAYRQARTRSGGNSIVVNRLERAYDELADPTRRLAYDAARAGECVEGLDTTPCLVDCPIVLRVKKSGVERGARVGALWLVLLPLAVALAGRQR